MWDDIYKHACAAIKLNISSYGLLDNVDPQNQHLRQTYEDVQMASWNLTGRFG